MTGTTETKIEHDRNNIVEHNRNDSYLDLTIVPVVFYYIIALGARAHKKVLRKNCKLNYENVELEVQF